MIFGLYCSVLSWSTRRAAQDHLPSFLPSEGRSPLLSLAKKLFNPSRDPNGTRHAALARAVIENGRLRRAFFGFFYAVGRNVPRSLAGLWRRFIIFKPTPVLS